ncbi:MAG: OmpA family protein [Planctomycetes bacterium]|nr:OmpA family protein [Planctomycetota bacterium]
MSRKPEEPKTGAPAYIVTFSDMITLLLTFFVLLLSMSDSQDKSIYRDGRSAFMRSIAGFGMPGIIFAQNDGSQFEHPKVKYKVSKGKDKSEDRSLDAEMEMKRRVLLELEDLMDISPSQIKATSKEFVATNISFKKGKWQLDDSAKQFIKKYSQQVQESFYSEPLSFYVIGLATSEKSSNQQWIVSARRAQTVADQLRNTFADKNWPVYSWGAGSGGQWTSDIGQMNKDSQIMIVMLINNRSQR